MSTITTRRSSSLASNDSVSIIPRKSSLANISVRSFSDFRAQTSSIPSPQSVKRKPLPANASPQLSCFSPTDEESQFGDLPIVADFEAPGFQASNILPTVGGAALEESGKGHDSKGLAHVTAQENAKPHNSLPRSVKHNTASPDHTITTSVPTHAPNGTTSEVQSRPRVPEAAPTRSASRPLQQDKHTNGGNGGQPALIHILSTNSSFSTDPSTQPGARPNPPDMSLWREDNLPRSVSDNSVGSTHTISPSKQQASKFTSFFGWKPSPRTGSDSPLTPFTDRSASPTHLPLWAKSQSIDRSISAPRLNGPTPIDVSTANALDGYRSDSPHTPYSASTPSVTAHLDELEKELKEVSAELAESIRREMDLEDEIDRCKGEPSMYSGELTRRTSDYFSDSGSSAPKGSSLEVESKMEELERAKRRLEQEKASIRAEYSTKIADEMRKRHDLEVHVEGLTRQIQDDQARTLASADSSEKVRELETFLEETRRRLSQERESRDNFEDLLAALRAELTQIRTERDNLVNEVVPQLKSQVETLEHSYPTPTRSRVNSMAEDPTTPWSKMNGLARSNSVFNSQNSGVKRSKSTAQHSGSTKVRGHESGEHKEIEEQRDALHKSLQNLIRRHEAQKREHARALKRIIADRDAATVTTSRRTNFARNVAAMKEDIVSLRRRVDEALTQKWQCEDSLGGVKMALDRAEQETRSLRSILGARPNNVRKDSDGLGISIDTSADDSMSMVKILRRSIQLAESERDAARREAESYRQKARTVSDRALADDLLDSAARLDDLAARLHESLQRNVELRERLSSALEAGELEQSTSTAKVVEMQSRLRGFEDALLSAQQASENALAASEEVTRDTDEKITPQVTRRTLGTGAAPTAHVAGKGLFSARSPRLEVTRSGRAESMEQTAKTVMLEERLTELERALVEADGDMKGVVDRVERSRTELSTLQGERENANRAMKKLQDAISEEKQRALRLLG